MCKSPSPCPRQCGWEWRQPRPAAPAASPPPPGRQRGHPWNASGSPRARASARRRRGLGAVSVGMSCAGRRGDRAVLLRVEAEQRCAEMVAEWLLQVVFPFCNPFIFLFCVIGQRDVAFRLQNRHLINLLLCLNCHR